MSLPYAFVINHVGEGSPKVKQYNLSTLAIVRSLGRRGVPVVLITTSSRDAVLSSKYVTHTEFCPFLHDSEDALLSFCLQVAEKYSGEKVLLPAVDECSYFVGKYHQQLSKSYLIPAPNWNSVSKINNKRFQYETAESLGIPIPETYYAQAPEEVEKLAGEISNYPYVIKPNVSFEWKLKAAKSKVKGKKGVLVKDATHLREVAKEIFVPGHEFMIQEVIGGRDERLVTCIGFYTEGGEPHSWFIRKKYRQCPVDFGYCTMTESCHNEQVFQQTTQLLKAMDYYGIAGVEWKLDPKTDKYKLIEINGRPVNTTGCAMASGVDLPAIAYFYAIGKSLPPVTNWEDGQRWAWLTNDFWAAKELISEGNLTWTEWYSSIKNIKADAVFAWDDFGMSFSYMSSFLLGLVKGKILSIINSK